MKQFNLERYLKPVMGLLRDAERAALPLKPACRLGCSGCCRRISVPATVIEGALVVWALNKEPNRFLVGGIRRNIDQLDRLYETLVRDCPPHEFFDRLEELNRRTETCPFLVGEQCCIYNYRPFACRLYAAPTPFGCQGCPDNAIMSHPVMQEAREELAEQLYAINSEIRDELGYPEEWAETGIIYRMLRISDEDSSATLVTPRGQLLIR